MRVVIVEDEDIIRNGLSKLVPNINKNCQVIAKANNGKEGMEIIAELRPDVVITDIQMPEMDGLQMLSELKQMGINHKTIILTAYSEFEYARKSITLGVSEYILKPISIADVTQSLKNVEEQLVHEKQEENKHPEALFTLEHVFKSCLLSELVIDENLNFFLERNYDIKENEHFSSLVIYLGDSYEEEVEKVKKELCNIFRSSENFKFSIIEMPKNKQLIGMLFNINREAKLEKYYKYIVVPQINKLVKDRLVFACVGYYGISSMKSSIGTLCKELHWNIVLNTEPIINYQHIIGIGTNNISYPVDIEIKIKNAICVMDIEEINISMREFIKYCKGDIYIPTEIKETIVRFSWAIVNTVKEIDTTVYEHFDSQHLLSTIMSAITWKELEDSLNSLLVNIEKSETISKSNVMSLVVKKTQSMIHEFYDQGITLEEIAIKLNITSEYLGTQFRKETGDHFSTYLKNYRINKAKKLLIGTDLKLYEISRRVGYNDPKYFSKVFKESTKQLPVEYRKLHK